MEQVFINGNFVAIADATISVFDRGFLFGDSVYEVIPIHNNRAYFLDRHITRLQANLEQIKIPMPDYNWQDIIKQFIESNLDSTIQIYIQITRGNQGERKHDIPASLTPTVVVFAIHAEYPNKQAKQKGLSAKVLEDIRWSRCDIKTNSLLGNILLNDEASSAGFDTTILYRDDIITEGSASNIFIVTNTGRIKTPVANNYCLPGITRQLVIELAHSLNWQISETNITIKELFSAQEVWMTSTTKEIFPIIKIDDHLIGGGQAGTYWQQIHESYQVMKSNYD